MVDWLKDDLNAAEKLVLIALENAETFIGDDDQPYITRTEGSKVQTWGIWQHIYRNWLSARYYELTGNVPPGKTVHQALTVLAGMALMNPSTGRAWLRMAANDERDRIYIDLANDQHDVVEIRPGRWDVIGPSPVRFRRARGAKPLPQPARGGSIRALRQYLNVASEQAFILVVSWIVAALRPFGPFPALALNGQQGSAKTTMSRVVRSLIDPNKAAVRSHPHEERDLIVAAWNSWVVAFDNLSRLPPWLSDALCRLLSGGGFGKRQNYTDMDEVTVHVARPVVMNGIDEMVTRGDLMDRSLVITLPPITGADRKTEHEFWRDFTEDSPGIFGVLLDGVAEALRGVEHIRLSDTPRMADFATWAAAAAPAFGWAAADFEAAYRASGDAATETVIDGSPIGRYVQALATGEGYRGTAAELLRKLRGTATEYEKRHWGWPHSPLALSNALRRLAPILLRVGVAVSIGEIREGRNGDRIIRIRTTEQAQFDE